MMMIHEPSEPSENWDDDFEFQQQPATPLRDVGWQNDKNKMNDIQPTNAIKVLGDSNKLPYATDGASSSSQLALASWAEPGPSTPNRRVSSTENWDDDFEDRANDSPLPQRKTRKSLIGKPRSPKSSRLQAQPESWDDEFAATSSPAKRPHRALHSSSYSSSSDSDNENVNAEFGFSAENEEDKTVTARSRRAVLPRLNAAAVSPPPPVPSLPNALIPFGINTNNVNNTSNPLSPTTSVFSVPASNFSNSRLSTKTSTSRTSGFSSLPPSPPMQKDRTTRRLRKKSKSQPQKPQRVRGDVFEDVTPSSSLDLVSTDSESLHAKSSRSRTPPPPVSSPPTMPPSSSPLYINNSPAKSSQTRLASMPLPSSPPGSTILSRIGSVKKKWGVRRSKRASTMPAEVMLVEDEVSMRQDQTSSTEVTPAKNSWFFRSDPHHSTNDNNSNSGHSNYSDSSPHRSRPETGNRRNTADHEFSVERSVERERLRVFSSSSNHHTPRNKSQPLYNNDSPSKLIKRKNSNSIFGGFRSSPKEEPSSLSKRPMSMQPQPSQRQQPAYAGVGIGHAKSKPKPGGMNASVESLNTSPVKSSRKESRSHPDKEKEGSRGFMGNVRRISLGGRHKRTKSGVSMSGSVSGVIAAIAAVTPEPASLDEDNDEDHTVRRTLSDTSSMDVDDSTNEKTPVAARSSKVIRSTPADLALLPPIELQPPSPPRTISGANSESLVSMSAMNVDTFLLASPALRNKSPAPSSPQSASLGRATIVPSLVSSSSHAINVTGSTISASSYAVPRRNSLGDLKIPARIVQAQVGLRRDLGMVREFAANVEQLKALQTLYHNLVNQMQGILESCVQAQQLPLQRKASPSMTPNSSSSFFRPLTKTRHRSNTNPDPPPPSEEYKQLAAAFYMINSKYRISWECAELLIELGGGTAEQPASAPPSGIVVSSSGSIGNGRKSRERAITLAGDEKSTNTSKSLKLTSAANHSTPLAWRASTGRHDLSQRQLSLLKEMLNGNSSESTNVGNSSIAEEDLSSAGLDPRWMMNPSSVTLRSEESVTEDNGGDSMREKTKNRRSSRMGMSGLRDMLRSLKKTYQAQPTSSTNSSRVNLPLPPTPSTTGRRRAKTSSGPASESMRVTREIDISGRPNSPYNPSSLSAAIKSSPRRPSLASIFRIGQKQKANPELASSSLQRPYSRQETDNASTGEEEDWDKMDLDSDLSDLDRAAVPSPRAEGMATVRGRGRSPYLHMLDSLSNTGLPLASSSKRGILGSQSSIWNVENSSPSRSSTAMPVLPGGTITRIPRLSNVDEKDIDEKTRKQEQRRSTSSKEKRIKISSTEPSPSVLRRTGSGKKQKTGSVRSMPPQPLQSFEQQPSEQQLKLAMSPENIRPLLENAKEVHARLSECIREIKALIQRHPE